MTERELATQEAYNTFACEIALYAYNDYIRYSIDLFTLDNPDENDITRRRFEEIARSIKARLVDGYVKRGVQDNGRLLRRLCRELKFEQKVLRAKAEECRAFFLTPHPICGLLGLNGENVIRKADKMVDRWIAGETIRLKKSVRSESFELWEDEDE